MNKEKKTIRILSFLKNILFILLFIIISCNNNSSNKNLVWRGGLAYKINSSTPFSGTGTKTFPESNDETSKMRKGRFKNGKEVGKWTGYWENGQQWLEGNYINGKKDGYWTFWWSNGNKRDSGRYKLGKPVGVWKGWWQNGDKYSESTFNNNGQLISSRCWNTEFDCTNDPSDYGDY